MNTNKNSILRFCFLSGAILFGALQATAQQAAVADSTAKAQPVQIPKMFFEPATYIWLLLGSIVIAVIFTLSKTINVLTRTLDEKSGMETRKESDSEEFVHEQTTWNKLMQRMTGSVAVEHEKDIMLDHDYDGIKELDNQLPPWWKWGFYLTIVFAFVYLINYHVSGSGKLQLAEYEEEMQLANAAKEARLKNDANYVTEATVVRLNDEQSIALGHELYVKLCVACHGDKGQGNVGPNMTDNYWIHGGGIKNVFATVSNGVPSKGMISWKSQLSPKQIQQVSSYILTLAGTNPPGAKEPQGTIWQEEPASSSASAGTDSTTVVKDSSGVKKI
ncbi:MAG TPA: cbb3-type cytochrome c oxidase N-terminal domain-containing protein [Bacteroidia bacterium]|nr:cbb3-type cytochrome c oxidase N-terminal domain-containing protein [Bacteroidia bacterium]